MLEAHERRASSVNDELPSVCCADADHEYDVDVHVVVEECATLCFGRSGERNDVRPLEHGAEVRTIRERSELYYVSKVGAVGVENVIVPVRFQETPMSFEIAVVGSDAISAIEYSKKIR
jgi:hypothetical protein